MPRILRIFNRMIIGGPAVHVSLLTRDLPAEYETMLLIGTPDEHERRADHLLQELDGRYQVIPEMGREISMKDDLIAYRKIRDVIREFKPDIVHTHTSKPGAIGRWAASACHVPLVLHTFHGHVFHSYFSPLKTRLYIEIERKLAAKTNRLIAISHIQRQELAYTYKIAPAQKIEVVPLGLDLKPFADNMEDKRNRFRAEFGLDEDVIAIGLIGRLAPIKRHQLMLDAVLHLRQHSKRDFRLFIVGDGECRERLFDYCREKGIGFSHPGQPDFSQPVIFTSWRTDIDVVNAGLDIIALTSLNEGTPVSIIEAQAAGRPVVATVCGGIRDVVLEGETALLSPVDDAPAFFRNLQVMVENDALRLNMGHGGTGFAFSRFGYKRLLNDMDKLYQRLLEEVSAPVSR